MTMIYTSFFANQKEFPQDLEPISIARDAPRGFQGRSIKDLAPTWAMLKLSRKEYDQQYDAILAGLSPREIYEQIGDSGVLLCWEPPNVWCHRRRVAEWLETELGLVIPEFGFDRANSFLYTEMPEAAKKQLNENVRKIKENLCFKE